MEMIPRPGHVAAIETRLRRFPVVALLGARQVGKTTLAREVARRFDAQRHQWTGSNEEIRGACSRRQETPAACFRLDNVVHQGLISSDAAVIEWGFDSGWIPPVVAVPTASPTSRARSTSSTSTQ